MGIAVVNAWGGRIAEPTGIRLQLGAGIHDDGTGTSWHVCLDYGAYGDTAAHARYDALRAAAGVSQGDFDDEVKTQLGAAAHTLFMSWPAAARLRVWQWMEHAHANGLAP